MKYLGPISDPKDIVNKEYVDNNASGHEDLTQSEYDALSQAEKENGTVYFITDGDPEYTIINDSVPIGAIQAFGGASVPYGWLLCDGSAVSRTTYSELFAAIGITHGSGDGATTFNLPDLRGRTLVGVGNSGATGSTNHTLGQKDGEEKHTLTIDEMPSHSHRISHRVNVVPSGTGGPWFFDPGTAETWGTSPSIEATGGSQSHNLMQPYTVANYIIKAFNTVASSALKELDPQSIIFDALYPVGSYYETSDATFDPNQQWSGTWVLDSSIKQEIKTTTKSIDVTPTGSASTNGYYCYLPVASWGINSDKILRIDMVNYEGLWRILNFYRYSSDWVLVSNSNAVVSGNVYIKYIEETVKYEWHRTA